MNGLLSSGGFDSNFSPIRFVPPFSPIRFCRRTITVRCWCLRLRKPICCLNSRRTVNWPGWKCLFIYDRTWNGYVCVLCLLFYLHFLSCVFYFFMFASCGQSSTQLHQHPSDHAITDVHPARPTSVPLRYCSRPISYTNFHPTTLIQSFIQLNQLSFHYATTFVHPATPTSIPLAYYSRPPS